MPPTHKPRLVLSASDAAKLEDIWKNHALPVRSMLLAFCSNPEDADDALQELFLRLGRNPSVLENTKSPRAFLAVSARRIAIDHARKRAAELRHSESPEAAEMLHPAASSAAPGDDLGAKILEALQSLPPEQRRVAESKLLHGKTLDAIAREEGVPLNTAASRLRYSLDKIRSRLRPIYKAMKNQPASANPTSDSTTRLIRPLDPKRVPSVVPGLEGVAALAVEDSQEIPELPVEIPQSENETAEEPILIVCPPCVFPPPAVELELPENTDFFGDEDISIFLPPENSDDSQEIDPIEDPSDENTFNPDEVIQTLFEEENSESTDEASGTELGDLVDCVILPVESEEESIDPTAEVEIQPFDPAEFNDYLLREYENFLSENPDWITENSGGDMHAQVITPSQYTDLELADPGAARAFDLWFENTFLGDPRPLPVEDDNALVDEQVLDDSALDPTLMEGVSLNVYGKPYEPEILLSKESTGTGIPTPWLRGGTLDLSSQEHFRSEGGLIAYNTSVGQLNPGTLTFDEGSVPVLGETNQTVVNNQVDGMMSVSKEGSISYAGETFGEGSYQFTEEGVLASNENSESASPIAAESSATKVTPVVSGSNSPIVEAKNFNSQVPVTAFEDIQESDSPNPDRGSAVMSRMGFQNSADFSNNLPVVVQMHMAEQQTDDAHAADDIAFTDDDSHIPAVASSESTAEPAPVEDSHADVAAAVGGAFVAGSATQVAPAPRGAASRKAFIG
jgi:RNA polymerase sigma-70 factor (ECF subfamily)